jgi:hypothetical protein
MRAANVHRSGRFVSRTFACVLAVVAAACGSDSPTAPSQPASVTFLSVISSPGDQIGNGFRQHVRLADGVFSTRVDDLFGGRQSVQIDIQPAVRTQPWWWSLRFAMPTGQPLQPGTYENARRWPGDPGQPGFEFAGTGSGCSTSTARFVISEVTVGVPGGFTRQLDRLRMTFEQTCDRATAPITGEISIAANPWR